MPSVFGSRLISTHLYLHACFHLVSTTSITNVSPVENTTADAQYIIGRDAEIAVGEPRGSLVHTDSRLAAGEKEPLPLDKTGADISGAAALAHDYEGKPTADELVSLRRVADNLPTVAYVLCFAELCEVGQHKSWLSLARLTLLQSVPLTMEQPM